MEPNTVTPEQPKPPVPILNASPPPDLTRHIRKISDQYLAGGGFGDVYRCRYFGGPAPREVAVKALRFKSTLHEDTEDKSVKMLHRELGIWKRLSHDNIVPFLGVAYGFGMAGAMSLVSLWMPNETLHKFLSVHDDRLSTAHRLQILLDIAEGLHYLHSFPIVHGDLNSNNVLLDADYTARIADFGYASLAGNIPEALAYLERSTCRPGSLRWIAPEQIALEGTSNRTTKSDIYSFGCIALQGSLLGTSTGCVLIFLQVLSGKQPWSEVREDMAVVLHLHLGHKPGRPESGTIDDPLWDFVQRCWLSSQERPTTDTILFSMKEFLSDRPPSGPLRDLFDPSPIRTNINPLDGNGQKRSTGSLTGLWNKIKQDSSTSTLNISEEDFVVFVMGPTRSGKSQFVRQVTHADSDGASENMRAKSPISPIEATRCELTDEAKRDSSLRGVSNIVFIDTPSFVTGNDQPEPQKVLKEWFGQIGFHPRDVGIIYMQRVDTNESVIVHLKEISKIPWPSHVRRPQRLHVVISCDKTSSAIPGHRFAARRFKLRAQVDSLPQSVVGRRKPSIHDELFSGEAEVAWRAVGELLR